MHKKITFRFMNHSDSVEQYIIKKLQKIEKFLKREPLPIYIDVVLESHRVKHFFKIEFRLSSFHNHIVMHAEGMDMYMIIDEVFAKVIKDITRRKEKLGHGLHLSFV